MKKEIELAIWGNGTSGVIFLSKRSHERRNRHKELILEVLENVAPRQPTSLQLQKLAGIRRSDFIRVLRRLIERGEVHRYGLGTKASPFKYGQALIG